MLGELYAQALEKAGHTVHRRLSLGGTDIALAALQRGEIDLYPEYTGTALVNQLHLPPESDPARAYGIVKKAFAAKYGLIWLNPSPFNDTNALASTKATAAKYGITTLSDLAAKAPQLRLGAVPEFLKRQDGLPGLQRKYGGFHFRDVKLLDYGIKYQALGHGDVDVVVAFSTEGQITAMDLLVYADDKHLFPTYQVAPVVRKEALAKTPSLAAPLDRLAPLLTDSVMRALNLEVEGPKKREPADVARDFLAAHGG